MPALAQRLPGIDAARGIALLGMVATHILPLMGAGAEPTPVGLLVSGRAAALFAVLAGIGLALSTGKQTPRQGRTLRAGQRSVSARALVLLAAGLTLGMVHVNVAVILVQYAALFLCILPFLGLRLPALAAWAGGWILLSPVAGYLLRPLLAEHLAPHGLGRLAGGSASWDSLQQPGLLLADIFVTGYYPVLQWISYLLVGLVLGRLALHRAGVQLALLAAGALVAFAARNIGSFFLDYLGGLDALLQTPAAARGPLRSLLQVDLAWVDQSGSWWWLATAAPHSGTTLDLIQTSAVAAAVVGLCLLLTRLHPRSVLPLSGAGAMTLTLYCAHVLTLSRLLELWPTTGRPPGWTTEQLFGAQAVAVLLTGTVFALLQWRGPLELTAHAAAALAAGRSRSGRDPIRAKAR
ncbi:MAG: DUF1624 domain-containing protein [Actinomycetota bacterium]|nr:DUF1624 domain-containing protein [Actinomycetota bacterium]